MDITNSKLSTLIAYRKKIGNCFAESPLKKKEFNENLDIDIDTFETLKMKKKWGFMDKILKHRDFIYYIKDFLGK